MFKLAGFLCIMIGCIGWGEAKIREEKSRVWHLRELMRIIRRIQDEIQYGKHTLPEICLILAEYSDIWYKCKCEGYLKEQKLLTEIKDIEYSLYEKRDELRKHRSNSLYEKSIEELKRQIEKIENDYRD